jgi:hypothetical protein
MSGKHTDHSDPIAKGKAMEENRREEVRDLQKGHHMAPRQNVTNKRKDAGARGSKRP